MGSIIKKPDQPGAVWDTVNGGVHFSIFSANAEKIELCLFDETGTQELRRIELRAPDSKQDGLWHVHVPEAKPGTVYGYRVHGPWDPKNGHRFNPSKLASDPHGILFGEFTNDEAAYSCPWDETLDPDKVVDTRDSAPFVPKSIVVPPYEPAQQNAAPRKAIPWGQTRIYEAHVKGVTKLNEAVPAAERGAYGGLASGAMMTHYKRINVNTLELMPIQSFVSEGALIGRGLTNYWGYNPLNFFTPAAQYGSPEALTESIERLHDEGLDVLLDVVYNHTAEGNKRGPSLCYSLIDNASYYMLDGNGDYINASGTGNTLNVSHPRVKQLAMDSLRYWVDRYKVDGFRFDLAAALCRKADHGYDRNAPLPRAIAADPVLSKLKLSGEPWDINMWDSYQRGNLPHGWREWNDESKKIREFWMRSAPGTLLAGWLAGSAPIFNKEAKSAGVPLPENADDTSDIAAKKKQSYYDKRDATGINFMTVHDGFTLHDVGTHNEKDNLSNGENNRDGTHEISQALSARDRRKFQLNMIFSWAAAIGTPILRHGDEVDNTQFGNNNGYCQDNRTSWVKWPKNAANDGNKICAAVSYAMDLRAGNAVLNAGTFPHGLRVDAHGVRDLVWYDPCGVEKGLWPDHDCCFGMMHNNAAVAERAPGASIAPVDDQSRILYVFNGCATHKVPFVLPKLDGAATNWTCLVNTDLDEPLNVGTEHEAGAKYNIPPRSTVIFKQQAAPA